jgi:L-threonylcarbamoyladenylate synthase
VSEPSLVVRRDDRDAQRNLRLEHLAEVRRILDERGFVLLPSDTAYSIAAWLHTAEMRRRINEMLERENEPISLAFPSVAAVLHDWAAENDVAKRLLECFTPGPITVVCPASRRIPAEFTRDILKSLNHTIGVRIPNSDEERQVAGVGTGPVATPVTTVPVRNLDADEKPAVTSFDKAVGIIRQRTEMMGGAPWCAIEGEIRYSRTSTVVEVLGGSGSYAVRREGAIPLEKIRACLETR